ncbi:hypothetical protein WJX81_004322 [Elliptochloris bilobata]|uniref:Replication factor A protein 3 n=1 Tax=Elliptochloris bilobata TaxID=381761 RepID=A0AAW1S312_9CHLO
MALSTPDPRVNFSLLERFVGQRVCLVGRVEDTASNFATVLAADGGKVKVKLSRPADFDSSFVEFIGTVDAPNQITEIDRTSFGNTFELSTYNELCKLSCGEHGVIFA